MNKLKFDIEKKVHPQGQYIITTTIEGVRHVQMEGIYDLEEAEAVRDILLADLTRPLVLPHNNKINAINLQRFARGRTDKSDHALDQLCFGRFGNNITISVITKWLETHTLTEPELLYYLLVRAEGINDPMLDEPEYLTLMYPFDHKLPKCSVPLITKVMLATMGGIEEEALDMKIGDIEVTPERIQRAVKARASRTDNVDPVPNWPFNSAAVRKQVAELTARQVARITTEKLSVAGKGSSADSFAVSLSHALRHIESTEPARASEVVAELYKSVALSLPEDPSRHHANSMFDTMNRLIENQGTTVGHALIKYFESEADKLSYQSAHAALYVFLEGRYVNRKSEAGALLSAMMDVMSPQDMYRLVWAVHSYVTEKKGSPMSLAQWSLHLKSFDGVDKDVPPEWLAMTWTK